MSHKQRLKAVEGILKGMQEFIKKKGKGNIEQETIDLWKQIVKRYRELKKL